MFGVDAYAVDTAATAVGLLRGQTPRGWLIVALSVTGALEALRAGIDGGQGSLASFAVMVPSAVQAVVAVVALVVEPRQEGPAEVEDDSVHATYTRLVEAHQSYADAVSRGVEDSRREPAAADASAGANGIGRAGNVRPPECRRRRCTMAHRRTETGRRTRDGSRRP